MPYTPALSFYLGPLAVYTSPTGMTDPTTGVPYLGGTLHEGDYVDATVSEISQWNVRFGAQLNTGRFRLVRVSPNATAANFGFGYPVGWALPTTVGQVAIAGAGTVTSGANGVYTVSSTTSGGTAKATAIVTVVSGAITSAQLLYGGAGFTSVPTFPLTEITGYTGGAGPLLAQMQVNPNVISSFDSSSINVVDVRGICLTTLTSAQVTANAWIVIQELGVAPLYVTTATATASGSVATAATAAVVTTTTSGTAPVGGYIGQTLDLAAAATTVRVDLALPTRQG